MSIDDGNGKDRRKRRVKKMGDAALVAFAQEFRDGILDGRPSRWGCFMVCAPLAPLLRMHGVECEIVETDLGDLNHFWIRLGDGRALDPTADQFNDMFPHGIVANSLMPPVYLGPPINIHGSLPLSVSEGSSHV